MIEKRAVREKAKILNWISLLEQHGPNLTRPYADLLKDGIHELRIKLSRDQIRVLYFFCYRNYIILTNSFTKNTDKVPEEKIKKAQSCKLDFLDQYTEKNYRSFWIMKTFKKHLEKSLKDPVFKEAYNEEQVLLQLSYELHQKREKAGLSQRDVALQAKLTQQQVSKVENGVNCNILTYLKVSNAVGLNIGIKPLSKTHRSSHKSATVKQ